MVDRKLVKNYFEKQLPVPAVVLAVIGFLFATGEWTRGFGIFLIVIGAAWMAVNYFLKNAATDEQVDALIAKELEEIRLKGLDKIGLVEEQVQAVDPIIIHGSYPYYLNSKTKFYYKKGKDEVIRASVIQGVVFYFSEDQVYSYSCVIDLTTGAHYTESTDEYFYKDIVSVSTKAQRLELEANNPLLKTLLKKNKKKEDRFIDVEQFVLTTSGGTSISAVIKDKTAMEKTKGVMDIKDTEAKIKGMRNLLREKKAV